MLVEEKGREKGAHPSVSFVWVPPPPKPAENSQPERGGGGKDIGDK